ncbi:MAG: PilZ domain-containing protein [Bryobacteraceae bacterium]|jgi:hypothetical protein
MSHEVIRGDRRINRRYDVELQLCFQYTDQEGAPRVGCGVTAELSRGGIRFLTDDPPPAGTDVEARIAWPFLLQDTCPLELVVRGWVFGVGDRGVVMRLRRYEFRTCGERSFFETAQPSGTWRVM